jgi:hypothetical protein
MSQPDRQLDPQAMKWRADGELDSNDMFALLCRLRQVEEGSRSNELWRLGQKYPPVTPQAHPEPEG